MTVKRIHCKNRITPSVEIMLIVISEKHFWHFRTFSPVFTRSIPFCSSKTAQSFLSDSPQKNKKSERNRNVAEYTHHFCFLKIYFTDHSMVIFPSTKQSCQPQSEIHFVLISEKQSPHLLWNHQVSHSTAVPYLPWSWWAILSLRGFSLLKAVTT